MSAIQPAAVVSGKPAASTLALIGICGGAFLAMTDTSVVSLLLPSIAQDFRVPIALVAWIPNAYVLAYALLIATAGLLGDRIGRKLVWMAGAALFAAGTVLDAAAPSMSVLIVGRVLQGVGAAAFLTVGMALLNVMFAERRAWAFGIYLAVGAGGATVGPFLGGAILQFAGWRMVFWILFPAALVATVFAAFGIVESRGVRRKPDLIGLMLVSAGVVALNFGLLEGPYWGWLSVPTLGMLLVAMVGIGAFIAWELESSHPMVRLQVFRDVRFVAFTLAGSAGWFSNLAGLYVAIFLQSALGLSPLAAGAIFLAWGATASVSAALSSRAIGRFGGDRITLVSMAVVSASFVPWIFASRSWPAWLVVALLIPVGWFSSWVHTVSMPGAISAFPASESGVASATFNTVRQFGSSLGIALPGAALAAVSAGSMHTDALVSGLDAAFAVRAAVFISATIGVAWLLGRK